MFAESPPLEHFQCDAIRQATPNLVIPLELRDQFTPAGTADKAEATSPQSEPVRIVTLSNQFDRTAAQPQTWIVREAVALAVPTHKPPHNPPVELDHYRCYAAYSTGALAPEVVGLVDQVTPILNRNQHLACSTTTRVQFQQNRDVIDVISRARDVEEYHDGP